MPRAGTSTERGYGTEHRKRRAALLAALVDGTPCPHCDQPMHRGQQLDADHSVARVHGGDVADRLAHRSCNRRHGGQLAHRADVTCPHHQGCGSYHSMAW